MTLEISGTAFDGLIYVYLTSDVDVDAGDLTLVGIDANGSHDVRGVSSRYLTADSQSTFIDEEYAQGESVTYVARTPTDTAQVTVPVVYRSTWITVPLNPNWSIKLPPATELTDTLDSGDGFLDVVGSRFPIVTNAQLGGRDGTVVVATDDYQQANDIVAALNVSRIVMLRIPNPAEASKYIGVDRVSVAKIVERTTRWEVSITYREVSRPLGGYSGNPPMTYGEILALGQSYSELLQMWPLYTDWGDLP